MTRAQAFSLLGVEEDASEADIRSAYRYVFSRGVKYTLLLYVCIYTASSARVSVLSSV